MTRLIIRPGAIRDCILSLPAIACLRAEFTAVWAGSANLPLIRFADRTCPIASTGLDLLGLPDREAPGGLIERLQGFDSIVSWYGANREEFREAVRGLPFHFLAALPDDGARVHAVDFYFDQARNISPCEGRPVPALGCPRRDEGFAVIHPFSGSPKKNWPLGRFRELAEWLSDQMPVRWCAGPNEDWKLEAATWRAEAVHIEDLYELACWLATARVYIGNDSGITHLAAAAGVPVVALFGSTDPAVWAPRGDGVTVVATETPGEPIDRISVEEAIGAVESTIRRQSAPDRP